uniref:Ovule protein n=1 Tax=Echinococcus granulosus TaxID=6210 RepID=A0A068WUG2_ECHGR|nr:hypothetical protein EgrG_002026000 [Echinococcus granulosus]
MSHEYSGEEQGTLAQAVKHSVAYNKSTAFISSSSSSLAFISFDGVKNKASSVATAPGVFLYNQRKLRKPRASIPHQTQFALVLAVRHPPPLPRSASGAELVGVVVDLLSSYV